MSVKVTTEYGNIEITERENYWWEIYPTLAFIVTFGLSLPVLFSAFTDIYAVFIALAGVAIGAIAAIATIWVIDSGVIRKNYYYLVSCGFEDIRVYKTKSHDEDIKRVKLAIKEMELHMKQQYEREKKLRDELSKRVG